MKNISFWSSANFDKPEAFILILKSYGYLSGYEQEANILDKELIDASTNSGNLSF